MKLKACILLFILAITTKSVLAKDYFVPSQITFTDGKTKKGLIVVPGPENQQIQFKTSDEASVELIESEAIKSIIVNFNNGSIELERIRIQSALSKKKIYPPAWARVLERGYVTLYFGIRDGGVSMDGDIIPSDKFWYCQKKEEESATMISNVIGTVNANGTFKLKASKYFADFEELASKIKDKTYTYKDIKQVVAEYNSWIKK